MLLLKCYKLLSRVSPHSRYHSNVHGQGDTTNLVDHFPLWSCPKEARMLATLFKSCSAQIDVQDFCTSSQKSSGNGSGVGWFVLLGRYSTAVPFSSAVVELAERMPALLKSISFCAVVWSSWCGVSKATSNIFVMLTQNWTAAGHKFSLQPKRSFTLEGSPMCTRITVKSRLWYLPRMSPYTKQALSHPWSTTDSNQFWITKMQINSSLLFSAWPVQIHLPPVIDSKCIILKTIIDSACFIVKVWGIKFIIILLPLFNANWDKHCREQYFSLS